MPRTRAELAESGESLITADGKVAPVTIHRARVIEVPSNSQAVAIIEGTRRKLNELPITPKALNPVACICMYTLYGLDIQEISVATGLSIDQINNIRMTNEYSIMQRAVVDTVMEANTGELKDYIKKGAKKAAERMDTLIDSPFADIALRASKDVLDRAGLRPADVIEVRGRMDMGLVIEVVDRKMDEVRPVIDMEE